MAAAAARVVVNVDGAFRVAVVAEPGVGDDGEPVEEARVCDLAAAVERELGVPARLQRLMFVGGATEGGEGARPLRELGVVDGDEVAVAIVMGDDGATPLHWAGNAPPRSRESISMGDARSTRPFVSCRTPVSLAAALSGRVGAVRMWLAYGADLGAVDRSRRTPMHCAAQSGSVDVMELLAEAGGEVDRGEKEVARDADLRAALASAMGAIGGIDARAGRRPLHVAARHGTVESVSWLVRRGADVRTPGGLWEGTPLHCCVGAKSSAAKIEALVAAGADVNAQVPALGTPLHVAAQVGTVSCVRALLAAGANPRAVMTFSGRRRTPAQNCASTLESMRGSLPLGEAMTKLGGEGERLAVLAELKAAEAAARQWWQVWRR